MNKLNVVEIDAIVSMIMQDMFRRHPAVLETFHIETGLNGGTLRSFELFNGRVKILVASSGRVYFTTIHTARRTGKELRRSHHEFETLRQMQEFLTEKMQQSSSFLRTRVREYEMYKRMSE